MSTEQNTAPTSNNRARTIATVLAIAAIVAFGWWTIQKNNSQQHDAHVDPAVRQAVENANCSYEDKDLCKFYAGWSAQKSYEYESTTVQTDGAKTTSLIKYAGDRLYTKLESEGSPAQETTLIGAALYTKTSDGSWQKQTVSDEDSASRLHQGATTFTDPGTTDNGVTYTKIGTEACGDHTCFKYQVTNQDTPNATTYIWFDNHDYQLQRLQTTSPEFTFDASYKYGDIAVNEPSPIKEDVQGASSATTDTQPETLPNTGPSEALTEEELQQIMQQYYQQ